MVVNITKSVVTDHHASVNTTTGASTDWSGLGGVKKVYITALTNDIFIDFDSSASSNSFRIIAGQHPTEIDFGGANVKVINVLSATSTADVYLVGILA